MTKQEAIENIENYIKKCNYTWRVERIFDEYLKYLKGEYISYTANDVIQNCHRSLEKLFTATAINALKEIQRYREIGTVEECREDRERQKPKKPKKVTNSGVRYTDEYVCPNCEQHFTGTGIAEYCYHCGQAIDWNENLGEMGDEQP